MSTPDLGICNRALALARARTRLTAIDNTTEEGYYCGLFWDETRQIALNAAQWNFANAQAKLVVDKQAGAAPADFNSDFSSDFSGSSGSGALGAPIPWLYTYKLPAGFLTARFVLDTQVGDIDVYQIYPNQGYAPNLIASVPFAVIMDTSFTYKVIGCNAYLPTLIYTYDVTDATLFDSNFEFVMVNAMSAQLAMILSGDLSLAKMRMDAANNALLQARLSDGNEGTTTIDIVPDWMRVRGLASRAELMTFPSYGPVFAFL